MVTQNSCDFGTGSSGQVLTSNGTGVAPTFQAPAAASITLNGNSGSASGSTITVETPVITKEGTPRFVGSASTLLLNFTTTDALVNLGIGQNSLSTLGGGANNCAFGVFSGDGITTGDRNTCIGNTSLQNVTSGSFNSCLGYNALSGLLTGSDNIAMGIASGSGFTGAESSNITIGNAGTVADNNTIRIGDQGSGAGQQNKCFIAGITGVTTSNTNMVTLNTSTGQLGAVAATPIANGGTNATTMSTSTGIVKFDGTSLVTSTTAKIDSSNRQTNTSQPAFYAFCSTNKTNVTGASVTYTIIFDSTSVNVGSSFNTGTGLFTAPVTGFYKFSCTIALSGITSGTTVLVGFIGSILSQRLYQLSLAAVDTGTIIIPSSWEMQMTSGDTVGIQVFSDNATQTVNVVGGALANTSFNINSSFSGYLVC